MNMSGWFFILNFFLNYLGNIECSWNIFIFVGYKIYFIFLEFEFEECGSSCICDYVEVSFLMILKKLFLEIFFELGLDI